MRVQQCSVGSKFKVIFGTFWDFFFWVLFNPLLSQAAVSFGLHLRPPSLHFSFPPPLFTLLQMFRCVALSDVVVYRAGIFWRLSGLGRGLSILTSTKVVPLSPILCIMIYDFKIGFAADEGWGAGRIKVHTASWGEWLDHFIFFPFSCGFIIYICIWPFIFI